MCLLQSKINNACPHADSCLCCLHQLQTSFAITCLSSWSGGDCLCTHPAASAGRPCDLHCPAVLPTPAAHHPAAGGNALDAALARSSPPSAPVATRVSCAREAELRATLGAMCAGCSSAVSASASAGTSLRRHTHQDVMECIALDCRPHNQWALRQDGPVSRCPQCVTCPSAAPAAMLPTPPPHSAPLTPPARTQAPLQPRCRLLCRLCATGCS